MKTTIKELDLNNKKVIIRCDFNVPIKDGKITDDNRIIESLQTINHAIEHGAKLILMSHLGRIKSEEDKQNNSLRPVAQRLSTLLNKDVMFIPNTRGQMLEEAISKMGKGDVLLIENTRFEDYPNKLESSNDSELAKYWASLGDIYINDAFGTSHRVHASNVGIATLLPNAVGFLIEKELNAIGEIIVNPKRPFTVILGGAKVSDKIGVIKNLVNVADHILVGGGMAYTFLKALGHDVGKSIIDLDSLKFCEEIMRENNEKIILPIDIVSSNKISNMSDAKIKHINDIGKDDIGLDIGPETIGLFNNYIINSKAVVWNGPLGVFEIEQFSNGTKKIAATLSQSDKITIIGGGDTAAAVINFGYKDKFTHISTGGGASLAMLEGKILPGIDIIKNR